MTINEMRNYILQSYPDATENWRNRVAKEMKPNQIIAIYRSIKNRERLKVKAPVEECHQIDIFEYMTSIKEDGSHTQIAL